MSDMPTGKEYWRSLDELADTPEFRAFVEAEFPTLAPGLEHAGFSAAVPEAHGGVDGAGRHGRLPLAA